MEMFQAWLLSPWSLQDRTVALIYNFTLLLQAIYSFDVPMHPLLLQAEQKVTLHGSTGSGKTWVASNVA